MLKKKLSLSRETLRRLANNELQGVAGGVTNFCAVQTGYCLNGTAKCSYTCQTCVGCGSYCCDGISL